MKPKTELRLAKAGNTLPLLMLAIAVNGCGKEQAPPQQAATAVTAMKVAARDVPVSFTYVARVESSQNVEINARVAGYLDSKQYTEGGRVKKGQTLFVLDQRPFKATLDSARAQLANSQAALETARLTLKRYQELTPRGAAAQADLDKATGTYQQAMASVKQAEAAVTQAELNLSYTVITSPVDGVSGMAIPSVGTYISPTNSKMTTVATLSPMWVNFSMSESQRQSQDSAVRKGLLKTPPGGVFNAEILLGEGQQYGQSGKITFASPFYNSDTGTFMLRASVPNPDGVLMPNQYVNIRLTGAVRPNAILVPQKVVQQGAGSNYVWVVGKNGKSEYRPVEVGPWQDKGWFIESGLKPGEQVVVDGVATLRPDTPLKIKPLSDAQVNAELGLAPAATQP